jgi:hypothetical protein
MTLTLELPPDQKRRLEEEAARAGKTPEDYALGIIRERLVEREPEQRPLTPAEIRDAVPLYKDLPRRDPAELIELAKQQGAPLAARVEDLKGDFWPEEETTEEFLEWLYESRREGKARKPA